MNSFWGLRTIPCSECGQLLQYHSSIRTRLRIGGNIFRFGLLVLALWLTLKVAGAFSVSTLAIIAWIGCGTVLAGVLATATRSGSIRVEVVSGT